MHMRKILYLCAAMVILVAFAGYVLFASRLIQPSPQHVMFYARQLPQQYRVRSAAKKQLAVDYRQHYFAPWHISLTRQQLQDIVQYEQQIIQSMYTDTHWGENLQPLPSRWVAPVAENMQLAAMTLRTQPAISMRRTDLRSLPQIAPLLDNPKIPGSGYPFDLLQESLVGQNTPLNILHVSKDGLWGLVQTPSLARGWVQMQDIARVSHHFMRQWQRAAEHAVTCVLPGATVRSTSRLSNFNCRLGELYPVAYRQASARRYLRILIAVRQLTGLAQIQYAWITRSAVQTWPLTASSQSIARMAQWLMGQPYGWGDLYHFHDCSGSMRDLFAPFAIWLPKYSGLQGQQGEVESLQQLSRQQKRQLITKHAIPFFTLIHIPGHILLYIGTWKQQVMVWHTPWGLAKRSWWWQPTGRIVLGKTMVSSLNLGAKDILVQHTWLDKAESFNKLLPKNMLRMLSSSPSTRASTSASSSKGL